MRQEGETQVLTYNQHVGESNPAVSIPIEAGARGELIAINSVRYSPPDIGTFAAIHWVIMNALSTNPEHEENPPASIAEFMESKALYARSVQLHLSAADLPDHTIEVIHVPMYGLLRPRRQIWVIYAVGISSAEVWYGLEVNYRPVKVDDTTLSEYNHRYGLYKRA